MLYTHGGDESIKNNKKNPIAVNKYNISYIPDDGNLHKHR